MTFSPESAERIHIGVMRKRREKVPEENEKVDATFGYARWLVPKMSIFILWLGSRIFE